MNNIYYVGTGIANHVRGDIYLHRGLLKPEYRSLRNYLLEHERGHVGRSRTRNMTHELGVPSPWMFFRMIRFMMKERGAAWQLLPIRPILRPGDSEVTAVIDPFTAFIWFLVIVMLAAVL